MKKYRLATAAIATDEPIWIGLDVAADSIAVCVLDGEMNILAREKCPYTEGAIQSLSRRLPGCSVEAAYEAGPTGYRLLRWLRGVGWDAKLIAPSQVPVASGDRVKTDKRDALKLATLLASKQLKKGVVHDLTDEQYANRQMVRCRGQRVRDTSRIRLQIKSAMLMHHIVPPAGIKPNWNKQFCIWLASHESGHPFLDGALREQLRWLEEARHALARVDRILVEMAESPLYAADVRLLRSIPGVGLLTALVLLTELPELVKRFPDGTSLARYLGLVPSEHSTGKTQQRRGHLTGDGNAIARTALVEAAWRLVGKDEASKARYSELKERLGAKKAIVAMARHLAVTIHAMFRNRAPYRRGGEEASVKQAA